MGVGRRCEDVVCFAGKNNREWLVRIVEVAACIGDEFVGIFIIEVRMTED